MKCQCLWHIKAVHLNEKPHEWILSKKIFSEMPVPRVHEGSPPHWEASWVWILQKNKSMKCQCQWHIRAVHLNENPHEWILSKKIFSEMPVPRVHEGSPPHWEASWVWILQKKSVKCQCQWNIKAVHLDEKPLECIFSKKDFQWNASANGTWRQSTSLRSQAISNLLSPLKL